jgi:hypothetical protein
MRVARLISAILCSFAFVGACNDTEPPAYRGGRLPVAALSPQQMAQVALAAFGGAFSIDDPTLHILIDPAWLPRAEGLAGGDAIPANVLSALRSLAMVGGTCRVPVTRMHTPLICRATRPGYVVRLSQPFQLGRDSVQMHLVAQQYGVAGGNAPERIRFERAYQLVRRGSRWRVVREARIVTPE